MSVWFINSSMAFCDGLGVDGRVIGDVACARSFGTEFAVHFHAHSNQLNTALSRLAIEIVAIASGDEREREVRLR